MNKIATIFLPLLVCGVATLSAQERPDVWDLKSCIDYAKAQNITIQKSRIALETSEINEKQAKAAWWPTLNFSTGASFSNRPFVPSGVTTIDGTSSDVIMASQNSFGANAGLNLGWRIYDGSRQSNIKQKQMATQQAELKIEQAENSLEEQILQIYVQTLYSNEAISVQEALLEASKALLERGEVRFEIGTISKSEVAQLQAQESSDEYNLVKAQSSYATNMLMLKQLLELEATYDLQLAATSYADYEALEPIEELEAVYVDALNHRPEMKICDIDIRSYEVGVKSAKSGYYPSLSMSAGTGINWNSSSNYSFAEQMKTSWSNSAGISLSLPILQGRQTKSAVEKAKLQLEEARLNKLDQQKSLRKTIESLWLDARSAQLQFVSAQKKQQAAQESYDLVAEQFNVGKKTATDVLSERASLLQATQQALQTKYMAIYSLNMLKFYQGNEITM